MQEKPDFCKEEHLEFLDDLRESNETAMYEAVPFLHEAFPDLAMVEARAILDHWMNSFKERHKA